MVSFLKRLKAGAKAIASHPIVKQAVSDAVEQGKAAAIGRITGMRAYRRGGRVKSAHRRVRRHRPKRACRSCRG